MKTGKFVIRCLIVTMIVLASIVTILIYLGYAKGVIDGTPEGFTLQLIITFLGTLVSVVVSLFVVFFSLTQADSHRASNATAKSEYIRNTYLPAVKKTLSQMYIAKEDLDIKNIDELETNYEFHYIYVEDFGDEIIDSDLNDDILKVKFFVAKLESLHNRFRHIQDTRNQIIVQSNLIANLAGRDVKSILAENGLRDIFKVQNESLFNCLTTRNKIISLLLPVEKPRSDT